ncbi:GNAT family N-acetyltransferase [Streptomyces phyllanthi]|uniref:GNAT family N-acetyltransferase n=1 Tax=Streptomyces phyllanthi TaxID=1803180 RepID=A0A5N8WGC2_9ACTN|nr:GNAT family N-acetyltransferase [Streptomyces phyllanthi]MPY45504.1 GNAT family N-acetyltransferase [Streptomyces phyllanthi]
MGGDQVQEAVEHALALLRTAVDQDWEGTKAGRLEWSCRETAVHTADCLLCYAGQLAGRATEAWMPFELAMADDAGNDGVLDVIETTATLLAATIRATPRDVRAFHPYPFRAADREGFAAMGVTEVLLHTHDIAEGLGLTYEAPAELCENVLTRQFPHVQPGPEPWPLLLWATGRGHLPGRAPVTRWNWYNPLVIPAERLTLHSVTPAAGADLATGGTGGFDWIEGGPIEGTRVGSALLVKAYEGGTLRPEWGMYVLVRTGDGRALGALGFHSAPDEEGRVEIGYDLVEAARGHGHMTEALRALAGWARGRDDVRSLFAVVDKGNVASQGVVTRAGFQQVSDDGEQFAYELRLRA